MGPPRKEHVYNTSLAYDVLLLHVYYESFQQCKRKQNVKDKLR